MKQLYNILKGKDQQIDSLNKIVQNSNDGKPILEIRHEFQMKYE